MKKLLVFMFSLCFSLSVVAVVGSAGKVILEVGDLLLSQPTKAIRGVVKIALKGQDSKVVDDFTASLIDSINSLKKGVDVKGKDNVNMEQFLNKYKDLSTVLSYKITDLSDKHILALVNKLSDEAKLNRAFGYLKHDVCDTCSSNVVGNDALHAARLFLEQKGRYGAVLEKAPPYNLLMTRTVALGTSLGIDNIRQTVKSLPEVDRYKFWGALHMFENGTEKEKKLGRSFLAYYAKDGKVTFTNDDALWKLILFAESDNIDEWSTFFRGIAKKKTKGVIGVDVLRRDFLALVDENPKLGKELQAMCMNGCFGGVFNGIFKGTCIYPGKGKIKL